MSQPGRRGLRVILLVAVLTVTTGGAAAYVSHVHGQQARPDSRTPKTFTREALLTVAAEPHLVFRNTARGPGYGQVALAPLSGPDGPRAVTPVSCDRVHAIASQALCLFRGGGPRKPDHAWLLGPDWSPTRNLPMTGGIPSRARLSHDGSLAATTTFVTGDSYASPGQFSTRTLIIRSPGTEPLNLQDFVLVVNGRVNNAVDRNMWGVTFADDDRFYATAASGGKTWLVEGSLSARRLTALREDTECPSLSPDRTRIAFKKHADLLPGSWRLAVYDLRTATETVLAEHRSVDDQVEWLDNSRVVYGLPRKGAAAASDIWVVPADGRGRPQLFVRDAWSPAVVR